MIEKEQYKIGDTAYLVRQDGMIITAKVERVIPEHRQHYAVFVEAVTEWGDKVQFIRDETNGSPLKHGGTNLVHDCIAYRHKEDAVKRAKEIAFRDFMFAKSAMEKAQAIYNRVMAL